MTEQQVNLRDEVLKMLGRVTEEGTFSHIVLRENLQKFAYLSKQERAFLTRLFEGTIEYKLQLDYILDLYSKTPAVKMKPLIRNILRMGVYQLHYMDQVPDRAACDEAVKLAKRHGFSSLSGFVNGVMRAAARNRQALCFPDRETEPVRYLSVRYSVPAWIAQEWSERFGMDCAEEMLKAAFNQKPMTARCNLTLIQPGRLKEKLTEQGIETGEGSYLPYAFTISGYDLLERIPEFRQGYFAVQDESSMLAAEVAAPEPDSFVMDVCAAPGGKAIHLLEKMQGRGKVLARDLTAAKAELISENIRRMQISPEQLKVEVWDACVPDVSLFGSADLVMADLPCSGLGVLAKKNDIKYRVTKEKQEELALLQRKILLAVKDYVKPGGILLYSTCTVSTVENEENAAWFAEMSGFRPEPFTDLLPDALKSREGGKGMLQLLPGSEASDGFFIAKFRKPELGK